MSEIVSGSARMLGGTMTMDVEVGHSVSQQRATGGTMTLEAATVIKQ
ncbi:MAG: hypothetical protein JNJ54_01465 [Myxococcaceae bacterium]|nr:hypothetical protein [Myxococcaceae bacterium]